MSKEKKTKEQKKLEKQARAAKPFISAWGYVGYSVLWFIPVLGWLIWFFNLFSKKTNKRSYARSKVCGAVFLFLFLAFSVGALFLAVALDVSPAITEFCLENEIFKGFIEAKGA